MKQPNYLNKGDKVGVVSTARAFSHEQLEPTLLILKQWGLVPVLGETIGKSNHQFSGTDEERAADIQKMMDDSSITAILCAKGGYGTVRILDKLNFNEFKKNPKWIIGFSDITALHCHLNNLGIETLHAAMPSVFEETSDFALESLRMALFGEPLLYEFKPHPLNTLGAMKCNIIGGNLSVLYSIIESSSEIDFENKILFLEDLDEYLYHIDRIMVNLKRSGKLEKLGGLIVGGMTKMHDNDTPFGKSAEEIIKEHVSEYDFPVCFGFSAGHQVDNFALILGRRVQLSVKSKGAKLRFY